MARPSYLPLKIDADASALSLQVFPLWFPVQLFGVTPSGPVMIEREKYTILDADGNRSGPAAVSAAFVPSVRTPLENAASLSAVDLSAVLIPPGLYTFQFQPETMPACPEFFILIMS